MIKLLLHEIKHTFGRYIAIMAIIALGVGFFSGLQISKQTMVKTADEYLNKQKFHDLEIVNQLGFSSTDIKTLKDESSKISKKIDEIEGIKQADFVFKKNPRENIVIRTHNITDKVDKPLLIRGKMPDSKSEVLADHKNFTKKDIGTYITISSDKSSNDDKIINQFTEKKVKIVGLIKSPVYQNNERGSTTIAGGEVTAFIYAKNDFFKNENYGKIAITLDNKLEIYSDDYNDFIDEQKEKIKTYLKDNHSNQTDKLNYNHLAILDRYANIGYTLFDSDTDIVDDLAQIFPIFFFLVAALVCMTTMSRMVDDNRLEIGTLKSLGYSVASISSKYILYSFSASVIGGILGFITGSYIFPSVIWKAYSMLYDYSSESILTINASLGIISIGTAVLCALLSTYLSCMKDLKLVPAALMQPPAPKPGKRILLERMNFLWSKLSFLYKVSLRNVFRYRKRFFMMIIGISGCSALLLAGLGINDSIKGISNAQFGEITKYTYSVSFNTDMNKKIPFTNETLKDNFISELGDDYIDNIFFLNTATGTITEKTKNNDKAKEEMSIIVLNNSSSKAKKESSNFNDFFNLRDAKTAKKIDLPKEDEIIICEKLAYTHDLKINDKLTFKLDDSDKKITAKIKGIAENYVHNFLFLSASTLNKHSIETPTNTAYVNINSDKINKDKEIISKSSAKAISLAYVNTTLISNDMIKRIDKTTKNLDSVVLLIILSAAGLAFIVLYNLSNINITERTREIATVKVLGFTPYEIAIYVFRESIILTAIGSLLGLGLGRILLEFVISKIQVEMIYYTVNIHWYSYILSVVLSFVFTVIVSIMMLWRLKRIDMVESLKSIE